MILDKLDKFDDSRRVNILTIDQKLLKIWVRQETLESDFWSADELSESLSAISLADAACWERIFRKKSLFVEAYLPW